jgi:hypothetical protein
MSALELWLVRTALEELGSWPALTLHLRATLFAGKERVAKQG